MTAPYAPPSVGRCAELACLIEATARKPGNVHPGASFADMTYDDFVRSAHAIAPVMEDAAGLGVGRTVLEAVRETRKVTSANTNLGIILLLAPLAAVPPGKPFLRGVGRILRAATVRDAELVYEAIRLANPGGMGKSARQDVSRPPTVTLLEAMRLAADRDGIARQYAYAFRDVLDLGVYDLHRTAAQEIWPWEECVIDAFLGQMEYHPDTLIMRKAGLEVAAEAGRRASKIRDLLHNRDGDPRSEAADAALAEFDAWLRADGNRRNPGTSADLTAASLFVALREGTIRLPWGPWEA
jgi:triphosphoribosyl-dephospho-CoA synthase